MRRLILTVAILIGALAQLSARDAGHPEELWGRGNTLYINGDYNGAVVLYDSIARQGYASARLYYNLGNAHFKAGNNGRAIVNYERALSLSPSDADARYNLAVANGRVKDNREVMPEFFAGRWLRALRGVAGGNQWAVVSLVMLALALGCALIYMLSSNKGYRKAGFFAGIVCVVLCVVSVSFAAARRREHIDASWGIVTAPAVSVKSSPQGASQELFVLHEGTKVEVLSEYGDWCEVMISSGEEGWLPGGAVERI